MMDSEQKSDNDFQQLRKYEICHFKKSFQF